MESDISVRVSSRNFILGGEAQGEGRLDFIIIIIGNILGGRGSWVNLGGGGS